MDDDNAPYLDLGYWAICPHIHALTHILKMCALYYMCVMHLVQINEVIKCNVFWVQSGEDHGRQSQGS